MPREEEDRKLAVLSYHKVGRPSSDDCDSCFYVPEDVFLSHLQTLRSGGWTVIDVATFLLCLDEPERLPQRAALITFDDGYLSSLTVAAPLLKKFEYPGIIFVPTLFIGGTNVFDNGVEPEEKICNWAELRELERCGVSVQSHGISHRIFSSLSEAELITELEDSARVLESGLQRSVPLFSFPYGDVGESFETTKELLRQAGYRAAFLSDGGVNEVPWSDRYALLRVAVVPDTDLAQLLG